MATIKSFEEMNCWIKARQVCSRLGALIDKGNFQNNYRLIHQIEGSSGSIMDNIAEGFERGTRAEFILFLGYAKVPVASCVHNCIGHLTDNILTMKNWKI